MRQSDKLEKLRDENQKNNFTAIVLLLLFLTAANAFAQTTAFNYQGRLTNAGLPPTANYDFQFPLFDAGGALKEFRLYSQYIQTAEQ